MASTYKHTIYQPTLHPSWPFTLHLALQEDEATEWEALQSVLDVFH